ncbi:hypothetical protein BCR34DRAFT_572388 [Clohesyomyces aquaticus]|uniref:DUF7730 domain-containing protein n=1 Tax=Clohesyomyces aquaticus TaxID=1231657 RepID=A0A1Y1Z3K1_9PLEO|nr:hypothetical protein BCR34DRAFT_572388 [Clohesyomyces aquaticus]
MAAPHDDAMNPQLACRLLRVPVEIRHAIYDLVVPDEVHLASRVNGEGAGIEWRVSECVEKRRKDIYDNGFERRTENGSDVVWVRRLDSNWGPHWECEEVAGMGNREGVSKEKNVKGVEAAAGMAFLGVCKTMYLDVMSYMVERTVIHVVDLTTLECFLRIANDHTTNPSAIKTSLASALPSIRKLNITMRFALPICEAIEKLATESTQISGPPSPSPENEEGNEATEAAINIAAATSWLQLVPKIAQLTHLRTLHVWIDHDSKKSWTVVHERAILSPLIRLANTSSPHLALTVSLPMLHPGLETPDRHFLAYCTDCPFHIHRFVRQRWHHFRASDSGPIFDQRCLGTVKHEPDFPLTFESEGWEDCTFEQCESRERELWKAGEDVRGLVKCMQTTTVHPGII